MFENMKKLIIAFTLLSMASCGIYNKYQPVEGVPQNLYGEEYNSTDSTNFADMHWREIFTDAHLQALIDSALAHNTDYLTAQWRIKEAEATLLAAKLSYVPSFSLEPQISLSSTGGQTPSYTYQIPLAASWEVDIFGRLHNAKKQAQALYAQSLDYQQAVRTELIANVANTYYTLLMLDEQLALAKETETAWEETVGAARALMNAGRYNEAGVAQMEATYYSVQTTVLELEDQIKQTENALSMILAQTPGTYERGSLEEQVMPEELALGVPVQILANRPDVRSAERTLEAAFYNTNLARSAFYPSITLTGSAGWANATGIITNPAQFVANALGSLVMPLFNRGKNMAQLKIAKAQQEEAKLAFNQTLINAGNEVNSAMATYQLSKNKTQLYENQVRALEKALMSTSLLMEHGTSTYLEVLTARQSLLNAQLSQVANRFAELQSVVTLYKALGGGRVE